MRPGIDIGSPSDTNADDTPRYAARVNSPAACARLVAPRLSWSFRSVPAAALVRVGALALASLLTSLWTALPLRAQPAEPPVDRITWLMSENVNIMTVKDGNGRTPRLVNYLRRTWPQVGHELLIANTKRSWQMIENGQPVCRINAVRTPEREKTAYFINTQLTPPAHLMVRRDKLTQLPRNAAGEVQLPRLLADPDLRGALVDSRSYGTAIDDMLARRPPEAALTFYAPRDFGARVLQMVALDRADYAIDYDMALPMTRDVKSLVSVPIQDAGDMVLSGIACPRTPWGLAAIRGVDRAIGRPEGAAFLRAGLMRWITPETRAHYAARFTAFYRERARPSRIEP